MARLGLNAVLKVGAAGATAAATTLSQVADVNVEYMSDELDVSTRAGGGWKSYQQGMMDASISFDLVCNGSYVPYDTLLTAFQARTPLAFLIQDAASGYGLDADFVIVNISEPQPLADKIKTTVTIKVNTDARVPTWTQPS